MNGATTDSRGFAHISLPTPFWLLGKITNGASHLRKSIAFASLVTVLLFVGCSSGVIVHDQTRAAELIVDFLTSFSSKEGVKLAYDWTDDQYKTDVSFSEFSQMVSAVRNYNLGAPIRLSGYEVFGAKETMVVYANSQTTEGPLFFKFSLVGTKERDYYLLDFETRTSGFEKNGIYREYGNSIVIKGV